MLVSTFIWLQVELVRITNDLEPMYMIDDQGLSYLPTILMYLKILKRAVEVEVPRQLHLYILGDSSYFSTRI